MPVDLPATFTAAAAPLEAARDAAQADDDRALAAILAAAIEDLERRLGQAKGADFLSRWTAERAVETLEAAGIEAHVDRGAARVELASGSLDILPAATREPVAGYRIVHRDASEREVAEYRVADNPKLAELVATVFGSSAPVVPR